MCRTHPIKGQAVLCKTQIMLREVDSAHWHEGICCIVKRKGQNNTLNTYCNSHNNSLIGQFWALKLFISVNGLK